MLVWRDGTQNVTHVALTKLQQVICRQLVTGFDFAASILWVKLYLRVLESLGSAASIAMEDVMHALLRVRVPQLRGTRRRLSTLLGEFVGRMRRGLFPLVVKELVEQVFHIRGVQWTLISRLLRRSLGWLLMSCDSVELSPAKTLVPDFICLS